MYKKIALFFLGILFLNLSSFAYKAGTRIMWDYNSLTRISQAGYPRLKRLANGQIFFVAEYGNGIYCKLSSDNGKTWSTQKLIKADEANVHMAVPEVIQLANGTILVGYNGRVKTENGVQHYDIRLKRSTDNGNTWTNEATAYTASTVGTEGCWEPSFMQLPSGEVQLFFANEFPYPNTGDQQISMVRSNDAGNTWSSYYTVSFRINERDGMPVPLMLKDAKGYVVVIEDSYNGFEPSILYSSDASWSPYISGNSINRWYPSTDSWLTGSYNGAPYIVQASGGETILSFQTANGRTNNSLTDMVVGVGDNTSKNFVGYSRPFNIPTANFALWNSLLVKNDTTVTAVTGTDAYPSTTGDVSTWVMTKDGYLLHDMVCNTGTPTMDGIINSSEYLGNPQVYLGAYSARNSRFCMSQDATNLYIAVSIKDQYLNTNATLLNGDAVRILLDPTNINAIKTGIYSLAVDINGNIQMQYPKNIFSVYTWTNMTATNVTVNKVLIGTLNNNTDIDTGCTLEIKIPWALIGGAPAFGTAWGINFSSYNSNNGTTSTMETIPGNSELDPTTWCKIIRSNLTTNKADNLFSQKDNPDIIWNGNQLKIRANDFKNSIITIFSISGMQIYKGFIQNEMQINMVNNHGICLVKFNKDNEQFTTKILMQY